MLKIFEVDFVCLFRETSSVAKFKEEKILFSNPCSFHRGFGTIVTVDNLKLSINLHQTQPGSDLRIVYH